MASRILSLCVDCSDAEILARFWVDVLDWEIKARGWQRTDHGPDGVSIQNPRGDGEIDFRWVPDGGKQDKNRLHLDLRANDRVQAAEHRRLLDLGAVPVDVGQQQATWFVLADPEGNEFCLCRDDLEDT